ncbi:hypothetical protein [Blastopirellula marina]|uniref:hypothetical protein n=1 Tax=Blastopirellula marina TaxID=124 RepID=UPI0011B0B159|nr:hypothetical protein [Blastopirellula marina]
MTDPSQNPYRSPVIDLPRPETGKAPHPLTVVVCGFVLLPSLLLLVGVFFVIGVLGKILLGTVAVLALFLFAADRAFSRTGGQASTSVVSDLCVGYEEETSTQVAANPFQSPETAPERSDRKRPELLFWGIATAIIVGCGILAALIPMLGIILAILILLPGLVNSYVELCWRRDYSGSASTEDQILAVGLGFVQLVPFAAVAALIYFGTIQAVVAHARATIPGGAEMWDVMAGAMLGLLVGGTFYVLGILIFIGWKMSRLSR